MQARRIEARALRPLAEETRLGSQQRDPATRSLFQCNKAGHLRDSVGLDERVAPRAGRRVERTCRLAS